VITWPEKEFKKLAAAFVRCNKETWQMSPNTSTALFTFPKDQGGLQIKMPDLPPKWSIPKKKMAPRASVEGNPRSGAKLLNV